MVGRLGSGAFAVYLLRVCAACLLCACAGPPPAASGPAAPEATLSALAPVAKVGPSWELHAYRTAIDEGLRTYFAADPPTASRLGEHAFDDQLPDLSEAGEARTVAAFREQAQRLRALAGTTPENADPKEAGTDRPALDARLLATRLEDRAYDLDAIRNVERDPSLALQIIGASVVTLISHDYAPKLDRMRALASRLEKVPALLANARARLKHPSHAGLENLAITGKGIPTMLRGPAVAEWQKGLEADATLSARLAKSSTDAAAAIDAYAKDVAAAFPLAEAKDEPIGAERWARLAALHEGVTESPAEVRAMGEKELVRLGAELDALIAKSGKKGETRKAFFTRLEKETPEIDGVLDEYRAAERRVEDWMRATPVADVPWDRAHLVVAPTPPHMRGMTFASMNAAGPLDSISDARMQVTEPNKSMPAAAQAALLRFHALGAIDIVSVHEAIPGHYLQFLYLEEVPSKVRKVTWSSTLSEGWAHYCEQMVLDQGFAAGDTRIQAYTLRFALQRAARVVVDVGENDGSMSLAQGAKFLEDHALLAPEAAKIEARRAMLWPANMFSYTYGKLAILAMRDAVKAKEGSAFDLKRFHDRLLSVGMMPVKMAGEVAFGDELK